MRFIAKNVVGIMFFHYSLSCIKFVAIAPFISIKSIIITRQIAKITVNMLSYNSFSVRPILHKAAREVYNLT